MTRFDENNVFKMTNLLIDTKLRNPCETPKTSKKNLFSHWMQTVERLTASRY